MIGLVAGVAVLLVFYNLGGHRTLGSHEAYAVVPARGMLKSGDWIIPRSGGEVRLRKPPLAYWLVAGSAVLFGGLDEFSARAPAALAALALTALMGLWAAHWYGRKAGIITALVQCTSFYLIVYARKAEIDMILCLCTTAALYLVATQSKNERLWRGFWRWSGIYTLLAVSWLAKFQFGVAMVLTPALLFLLIQHRYRNLWNLANPPGLAILTAAIFIWPYLVLQVSPEAWQIWKTETLGRAVGELSRQPVWYYLPHLLWQAMPWTAFVILGGLVSWRLAWKKGDYRERFIWIWFLTDLVILTASANKHPNYLNALLPAFSLLAGRYLSENLIHLRDLIIRHHRVWALSLALFSVSVPVALIMIASRKFPYALLPITAIGFIICSLGGITALFLKRKFLPAAGAVVLVGFLACYLGVMGWIMPRRDHRLPSVYFAQTVRKACAQQEIIVFSNQITTLEFYLGEPLRRIKSLTKLQDHLARHKRLLVVADEPVLNKFRHFAAVTRLKTETPVAGFAPSKQAPRVLAELRYPSSS